MSTQEQDLALRLVRRARLLGRVAMVLQAADRATALPETAAEQLESALALVEARERRARWELNRLASALQDEPHLSVTLMKGCSYVLLNLPNAAGRLFADVDLLVAERDLGLIERCLLKHGWLGKELSPYDQNFYRAWSHELPPMTHPEREVEIDIHHNILGRYARFKPDAKRLIEFTQSISGTRFRALESADIIIQAITHWVAAGDLVDSLRDLVDIDLMLRHFMANEPGFCERLVKRAIELDLGRPTFYALRYCERFLSTPLPAAAKDQIAAYGPPAPVRWLMDCLVPRAVFPEHPDFPERSVALARLLLFIRSHWISMPPLMLARHLGYKFYLRRIRGRGFHSVSQGRAGT